jgi:hypothetical protein
MNPTSNQGKLKVQYGIHNALNYIITITTTINGSTALCWALAALYVS